MKSHYWNKKNQLCLNQSHALYPTAITCSKSTIETLEQGVEYVQS